MRLEIHYTRDDGSRKGKVIEDLNLGDGATRTAVFQAAKRRLETLQQEEPQRELGRVNCILSEGRKIFYRGTWYQGSQAYKAVFGKR